MCPGLALFQAAIWSGSSQVARSKVISTPPGTTVADRIQPKSAFLSVQGVGCGSDVVWNGVRDGVGEVDGLGDGEADGVGGALAVVVPAGGPEALDGVEDVQPASPMSAATNATPVNHRCGMSASDSRVASSEGCAPVGPR